MSPQSPLLIALIFAASTTLSQIASGQTFVATPVYSISHPAAFNVHGQILANGSEWYDKIRVWDASGGSLEIPKLPGTQDRLGWGYGINDAGQVAGYNQASNGRIPFLWTEAGGLQDLSSSIGGYVPVSINNHGQIVGNLENSSCLWDPVQGFQLLPFASAVGVNDSGLIAANDFGGAFSNAFIWTPNQGFHRLLPTAGPGGAARGVNNAGQVVGYTDSGAFLWDQQSGLRNLNDLAVLPENERLIDSIAINNNGEILAEGRGGAVYLLTPIPEPTEWTAMAGIGVLGSAICCRLHRHYKPF